MATDAISLAFIGRAIQSMQKDVASIKSDSDEMRRMLFLLADTAPRRDEG